MALLNAADLAVVYATFVADLNATNGAESIACNRPDVKAAIAAADAWADANAASYNAALPLPARTALTARQKARLLRYVIQRRFEVS